RLEPAPARWLLRMIAQRVNTPWTTSMGRLFDAVAALLLPVGRTSYEGEAAIRLEALADGPVSDSYELAVDPAGRGDWGSLRCSVLNALRRGTTAAVIAARFHQALAKWAAAVAARYPGLPIVLGGGCFQNRLLLERTRSALEETGRRVYHAGRIPPGDGGLAA